MEPNFGKIIIEHIENIWSPNISKTDFKEFDMNHVNYVYYPDCQQLIMWLPNDGYKYQTFKMIDLDRSQMIIEDPIQNRLSGSIQIIMDSLEFLPAHYCIEVDMAEIITHKLYFQKLEPNIEIEEKPLMNPIPEPVSDLLKDRRRYYDSAGKLIPDDIDFRESKMNELFSAQDKKLEIDEQGRSGTIHYIEGNINIPFDYEFGGGNCIVYIFIPTEVQWFAATGIPLERRKEIIEFVAVTIKLQKVPNSSVIITDQYISYYES